MFDTDTLIGNEVFDENDMIEKDQDVILKEVSTAAPSTTAVPPPDITEVEITLAQTLAKLKSAKSKVVIQEPVQSTTTTSPSTIPKAKGITFRDCCEFFERRKKQLAAERVEAIRNKPPIRTQVRNRMITYLKNIVEDLSLKEGIDLGD
ncbi:hypothetical protein Tco_1354891 [Tanacetum coccineum]